MGRYGNLDYSSLTRIGFLTGLALFSLGAGGELLGSTFFGSLPAWEHTLFLYSEAIGIVVAFFTPWIFGVFLPLTE